MIRNRLTSVLAGAVVALLVVATVDALRSSGGDTTEPAPTASTTTTKEAIVTPPPCAWREIAVSIRIRGVATIFVRNAGARPCFLDVAGFRFTIRDRAGRRVGLWTDPTWFAGDLSPDSAKTVSLPAVFRCDRPGPYVAIATVGPYSVRRGSLSRSEITC
jgi:hypothetical protein